MPEEFESLDDLCSWLLQLNPHEPIDMHEAMTIYYNQEIYGEQI